METPGPLRFLALGDSYTIGEGVAVAERWPVQLAGMLRERGINIADPEIIAKTGWTTDELANGIDGTNPEPPYDLVSLGIGVNNQHRGRGLEEYREQFHALLARAIAFAHGEAARALVLSIPDWSVTPFAEGRDRERIARDIDAFNGANYKLAAAAGAHYVEVTSASRAWPNEVSADGLHPSGKMYRTWAERALGPALGALKALA
jgi:lysophospholipase L1-like esterase